MADLPRLTLVATPIGNLGDLSGRARGALAEADFWIVEDTRVSGKLLSHLDLKKPLKIFNEHSSPKVLSDLLEKLESGDRAALLTDAGSPCISDPGTSLVDACLNQDIAVDAIPGPSAVIDALTLSGFYAQQFCFLGFLPRKPGPIQRALEPFAESSMSLVLFESPHRFRAILKEASVVLGERRFAICRELTKVHQQVFRSRLPYIPNESEVPSKGEFVIVIEGARRNS